MTLFLQVSGGVLLSVILVLTLKGQKKEFGTILAVSICCICATAAMHYLQPVLTFLGSLEDIGGLDREMVSTLLKVTGIGIICKDAGNESMGKALQLLGSAVILYLSLPVFNALIGLLQRILGEL